MTALVKLKQIILVLGDLCVFYIALILALIIRYRALTPFILHAHLVPFTVILLPWEIIFYISGLYDIHELRNTISFWKIWITAIISGALLSALFFYFIPFFSITPKTNLVIFVVIFAILSYPWRTFSNRFLIQKIGMRRVMLFGASPLSKEIQDTLEKNPQLGFTLVKGLPEKSIFETNLPPQERPDLFVISSQLRNNASATNFIYSALMKGYEIMDLATFYETIFKKVPLSEINEVWFLEHVKKGHTTYETLIRPIEFILALILTAILLPFMLVFALIIKLTSRGPIFYRQTRIGKNRHQFTLYKFRTMKVDAESEGPRWAEAHDSRVTRIGTFLRFSHLDEAPQLLNILSGRLGFVGPRPERPEFVEKLEEQIPYYNVRNFIKPGLTGWAQINYRYGATVDEAKEKLEYDIFYLKNRSFTLDIIILLKTVRRFFSRAD